MKLNGVELVIFWFNFNFPKFEGLVLYDSRISSKMNLTKIEPKTEIPVLGHSTNQDVTELK